MKKRLSFILIITLSILVLPTFGVMASSMQVAVGDANSSCGDYVDLPVVLSGNTGFTNLGLEINYDTAALELVSVTNNPSVGGSFTIAQTITTLPYNFSWSATSNQTFNGTIATIKFKVLASNGNYPVSISYYKGRNGDYVDGEDVNYDENDAPLNLKYVSGNVKVTSTTISSMQVLIGTAQGACGDFVELPVVLSDNTGFTNLGLEINYDTAALELVSVTNASSVGGTFTTAQSIKTLPYNFSWSAAQNQTFNGTIATIKFKILASSGSYPVSISYYKGRNGDYVDGEDVNYDENDAPLNLSYVSGKVDVSGGLDVCVNGKKVTLNGTYSPLSKVIIAVYEKSGKMKFLETFAPDEIINKNYSDIISDDFVKVMWWSTFDMFTPLCPIQIINF